MIKHSLVSIIVPVYNSYRFLSKCLNSIIKQTYADLDIVIIDDGSTDKSGDICDRFAKKDKRIRVFHKENEGVSVARNLGINKARGEYIVFVDSDDWLSFNAIEIMLSDILSTETDLVVCNYVFVTLFKNVKTINPIKIQQYDIRKKEDLSLFFNSSFSWRGPCSKIYKKSIIDEHGILFREGIKYGEDTIFNLNYLMFANKVVYQNKNIYF